MTLSSLWAAKCSGLFEDSPRGNVSCGRVTIKFAQCELDCSVRIRKNRVQSSNNLYGSYGVRTVSYTHLDVYKRQGYHPCDIGILTCAFESRRGTLLGGQFDWGGRLLKDVYKRQISNKLNVALFYHYLVASQGKYHYILRFGVLAKIHG